MRSKAIAIPLCRQQKAGNSPAQRQGRPRIVPVSSQFWHSSFAPITINIAPMKKHLIFAFVSSSLVGSSLAQETPSPAESTEVDPISDASDKESSELKKAAEAEETNNLIDIKKEHEALCGTAKYPVPDALLDLPEEKRLRLFGLLKESFHFILEGRVQEALHNLYSAEQILPDYLPTHLYLGAAYIHIRDHENARQAYEAAQKIHNTISARINIAETWFGDGNYKNAEEICRKLLADKNLPASDRKLIKFKQMICLLKLGQREKVEDMIDGYSPTELSPIYLLGKAILSMQEQDLKSANRWIDDARVSSIPLEFNAFWDAINEAYYRRNIEAAIMKLKGDVEAGNRIPVAPGNE